ncbi:MAG TPA: SPFH domain-containing protein [Aggregatilineaceae bacterium]|nr:SPFH domain-containing protein [Aggregatilineaceae bacterium]
MLQNLASLIVFALVVVAVGWLIIRLLSRSYVKTTATTAFVRTGGLRGARSAKPTVVMNGAAWVFGFLHRIKWVSLETMALEVRHLEENALITSDPQYVDLEARFFVKIAHDVESISIAARTVGGEMVNEASVRRLVEPKINGAVRDVAATFDLRGLLERRMEFIQQVQARLKDDLAENGLVLESVSILILRPTLQGQFSTEDILGAQVARANAAVIEQALTEKTRLERTGSLDRARLDAEAERQQLSIQEEIDVERAQRVRNIATVRAQEEAGARVAQEQRREEAERAKILADRALEEERLENERLMVVLREQMQKALELEKILREEAVALAEQDRETRIVEATVRKLTATLEQIEADKAREQATQEAITVVEKAVAEREAEVELINARLDADRRTIEARSEVDIEAMRLQEMAEAERNTAVAQAEAMRTRAEADLEATKLAARGERERASAAGLAEVQVALERVKVLQQEADATRHKLLAEAEGEKAKAEALASHDSVAKEMELARLNGEVLKTIEIARAKALGEAISSMKMNLYGDAGTAYRLLQLVTAAQATHHVYDALPSGTRDALGALAERLVRRDADGSKASITESLSALMQRVERDFSDAIDENTTLGQVVDAILEKSADAEGDIESKLRPVIDNPALRELPLKTVLALARDWLGWKYP